MRPGGGWRLRSPKAPIADGKRKQGSPKQQRLDSPSPGTHTPKLSPPDSTCKPNVDDEAVVASSRRITVNETTRGRSRARRWLSKDSRSRPDFQARTVTGGSTLKSFFRRTPIGGGGGSSNTNWQERELRAQNLLPQRTSASPSPSRSQDPGEIEQGCQSTCAAPPPVDTTMTVYATSRGTSPSGNGLEVGGDRRSNGGLHVSTAKNAEVGLAAQEARMQHCNGRQKKNRQQAPRIAFIGIFLNGIAVTLASFTPVGGEGAKALVKEVLLDPSAPVLPENRYISRGLSLAVYLLVDRKNRVYSCVTTQDVPTSVAFSLLEEIQIQYLSKASNVAFSTRENFHTAKCQRQLSKSWAKHERIERILVQERDMRRELGEELVDLEAPGKNGGGLELIRLKFNEHGVAAGVAQHLRSREAAAAAAREIAAHSSGVSQKRQRCLGTDRGVAIVVTFCAVGFAVALAMTFVISLWSRR